MFDGNFRSGRREVNLSTNRRGRRDLLKNAEAQRKQRAEQNRRDKAARCLQRVVRGYLSRLKTVQDFLPRASSHISALCMCLTYHSWLYKFKSSRRRLLLHFEPGQHETPTTRNKAVPMEVNDNSDDDGRPSSLLDNSMQLNVHTQVNSSRWFSQKRMIQNALEELNPTTNNSEIYDSTIYNQENNSLYQIVSYYWDTTRVDDQLFLVLALCLQKWCVDPQHPITKSLTQWSIETSEKLNNRYSLALLATILLGSTVEIPSDRDFSIWFAPLAEILSQQDDRKAEIGTTVTSTNTVSKNDVLLQATLDNLRNGKEYRLLSNLLGVTKSPQLVALIHYILSQPQNEKLKLAVSLIARGDALDNSTTNNNTNNVIEWDDMEESDGEGEDSDPQDPMPSASSAKPSNKKKHRASTQYKRQELLTLVKLDRLYQERIEQSSKKYSFDPATRDVASRIVQAPWLEWGLQILGKDNREEERYLETLGTLLQASSTLRPKTKLSPLSVVAFNRSVLERLWKCVQERKSDLVASMFADLFSHYLVALSDQDFLRLHCKTENHECSLHTIMATDLVISYQSLLYEVYWTKPVLSYEMDMNNARGRLILSGTKLWNSLYERWNRLVKNSFVEEQAWWFPYLSTREGDKAVVPARERDHVLEDDADADGSDSDDEDNMDIDEAGPNELSAAEAETDALADSFRDPKMARVLTSIPQALPFDRRVKLFHSLLQADKHKTMQAAASRRALMAMGGQQEDMMWFDGGAREQITIHRANLYQDSMQQLNSLGNRLKHKVQVTFVNQHGTEEAGIDGGGVFKEFVDDLIKDGFAARPDGKSEGGAPQLFSLTPDGLLTVNFDLDDIKMLPHYSFLGRVLSKAVYEGILVEPQFCLPFLNLLLGKVNTLEDLKNFDEEYYKNLNKLRQFTDDDFESAGLTFELTFGGGTAGSSPRTVDLVRNGRSIPVTKKNVFQYTHAVANQLLNVQGAQQTRAFLHGFRDLVPVSWVRLFSAKELQKLISGDDSIRGIDVSSLKKAMHYLGGYHESQPYIQDFWDILENELTPEQQRKFLRFMTSCSRQPLLGFSSLEPVPSIQQIRLRDDELSKNSRLPTSQTCMNLLKLPNYKDKQLLREKLLAAVEAGAGFELT